MDAIDSIFKIPGFINDKICPSYAKGIIEIRAINPLWETRVSYSLKKAAGAPTGSSVANAIKLPYFAIDEVLFYSEEDLGFESRLLIL